MENYLILNRFKYLNIFKNRMATEQFKNAVSCSHCSVWKKCSEDIGKCCVEVAEKAPKQDKDKKNEITAELCVEQSQNSEFTKNIEKKKSTPRPKTRTKTKYKKSDIAICNNEIFSKSENKEAKHKIEMKSTTIQLIDQCKNVHSK